ncbi:hypothetical protein CLOSAC_42860 [Clostridium saccharobutylicum]|uniref:Uncharacterized protein n=1 Tax=Clostridium saccharobutylicum TaxID=169679 RepID=A0A1S8MQH7_CLOSA|nr:hypothetical protein CLOSAC_42860 [Clostridium saccharobutylicum]
MKTILSYLKLDLRISKRSLLCVAPALIFSAYMFFEKDVYILGCSIITLIIMGYISYLISCRICRRREV